MVGRTSVVRILAFLAGLCADPLPGLVCAGPGVVVAENTKYIKIRLDKLIKEHTSCSNRRLGNSCRSSGSGVGRGINQNCRRNQPGTSIEINLAYHR